EEGRLKLYNQAQHFIQLPQIQKKATEGFSELIEAFIRRWIDRRGGLATRSELIERLEKRSLPSETVEKMVRFLEKVLGKQLFNLFLTEVEENLYTSSPVLAHDFNSIVACAKSYFLKPNQVFLLEHLVALIEREKAAFWQGFEEGFV